MPLSVYDNLLNFEREIDELFQDFGGVPTFGAARYYPAIDIVDHPEQTELIAELPGIAKEDVHINVNNGLLTISGERKLPAVPEKAQWIRNEVRTGPFSRSIQLPKQAKADGITAEMTNGVLKILLPKAEEAKPREIRIK